ncbi:MAG: hypothetical protein PHX83_04155 [Acidobacteriia bacterium]|nr:hypothetical protein [Terriglobia bacterium]
MRRRTVYVALMGLCFGIGLSMISGSMHAGSGDSPQAFARLLGRWSAIMSYVHSGNEFTVSRADNVQIQQLDSRTIVFSIKPMVSAQPVFDAKLTYVAETKKFFLTINSGGHDALERTELAYDPSTGFSGTGVLRDIQEKTHPVEVKITFTGTGGHEWTIKDLTKPGKSIEVFAFTFSKRLD